MEPAQHKPSPVADSTSPSDINQPFCVNNVYFDDQTLSVRPVSNQLTVSHCEPQDTPTVSSPGVKNFNPTADKICTSDVVRQFRLKYSKNLIISHYNVNSIRHKFCEISPIMNEIGADILAIAESKLDDSFPSEQFSTPNYKLHRQDRDSHGGGIMIYVNGCIPHRLIKDHTGVYMGIEFMTLEISVKSSKWKLCYIYKPPRVTEKIFCDFLSEMCERFFPTAVSVYLVTWIVTYITAMHYLMCVTYLVSLIWSKNPRALKVTRPLL